MALFFLDQILSVAGMGVALFWSAGRLDWWAGWAAIAVWSAYFAVTDILMLRYSPGLIAERLHPPKGAKSGDRALVSLIRITELARYILAGLDQRYSWTVGFPAAAQVAGLIFCALGLALFGWAMLSNPFFSQIHRIQSDRGHAVVSAGPYRSVRHPGYMGMIVFEPAVSTLLGSWPAIIAGGLCSILLILRTAIEDRSLQAELTGYTDYARRVRFRLLPGIW